MNYQNPPPLLDALDEICVIFDDTERILGWNQALVDATGYAEDVLAAMTLADVVDDSARVMSAVDVAFESASERVDVELRTAHGETLPTELTVRRLSNGDEGVAFVGIGRDISERLAAERERQELLERMSDAFFAVDTDWRLTHANERGTEVLSQAMQGEHDELEGLHLWEEIPDAVGTTFYDKYLEAMRTQETVTFEEYYPPLDTWFEVRAHPSETGLSVFFHDVTDRRRQRDALEHRERVLRELYDVIADRERPFEEQVTALLELGREELGTAYGSLSRIDGDEYVFEVVATDDDSIEAGDVVPLSATNCEVAASTERTLVLGDVARDAPTETDRAGYAEWGIECYIGAPVFDDDIYGTFCFYDATPREGQFSEWEVTLVDLMSRWVSYELHRQRTTERLQRQNERLDRFASVVSHDLRNPLNVLEGRLELAAETGDEAEFDHCQAAVDRMNELVEDLLVVARAGTAVDDPEPVDLASFARRCWEGVETAEATLLVETERTVQADETRLRQLIENLYRNSVEHGSRRARSAADDPTDQGEPGEDTIDQDEPGEEPTARPGAPGENGGMVVRVGDIPDGFYVADDGPGIPPEDRATVFESGYSTQSDGTGFGLSIVEEVADAHGWDVDLTASASGGVRFEFTGLCA